ncbi:MAG TPA: translesion DNA synthesis-associated protein ImuA [Burkholderiaceae bacterium]|nr:translesion DNA synthesis-associated protein ImuA [Burkholderiaceae bacterium]
MSALPPSARQALLFPATPPRPLAVPPCPPGRKTELPPQVWPARMLAQQTKAWPSGHAALDAQLPGGGWPLDGLVELLQDTQAMGTGACVWQLIAPGLAARMADRRGMVVLVNAPHRPFGPALQARGITSERLICVQTDGPHARLWAAEQALRCADVLAVLAWLPQVRHMQLQRLNVLAQDKLLFVLREARARYEASPAPLRLLIQGDERLEVQVIKRRGPPSMQPLDLPGLPERLQMLLASRRRFKQEAAGSVERPSAWPLPVSLPQTTSGSRLHALDRTAIA